MKKLMIAMRSYRAPGKRLRLGRYRPLRPVALQPIREALLQICCSCSQRQQSMQFMIADLGNRHPCPGAAPSGAEGARVPGIGSGPPLSAGVTGRVLLEPRLKPDSAGNSEARYFEGLAQAQAARRCLCRLTATADGRQVHVP